MATKTATNESKAIGQWNVKPRTIASTSAVDSGISTVDNTDQEITLYVRPGRWERKQPGEDMVGTGVEIQMRWIQVGERFSVKIRPSATWSDLVSTIAEDDFADDYTVVGGEIDGAAHVPLDSGHPEFAVINFFAGKRKQRIVTADEYRISSPISGQPVGKYGCLTRSEVLNGGLNWGACTTASSRAATTASKPHAPQTNSTGRFAGLHQETVVISTQNQWMAQTITR